MMRNAWVSGAPEETCVDPRMVHETLRIECAIVLHTPSYHCFYLIVTSMTVELDDQDDNATGWRRSRCKLDPGSTRHCQDHETRRTPPPPVNGSSISAAAGSLRFVRNHTANSLIIQILSAVVAMCCATACCDQVLDSYMHTKT